METVITAAYTAILLLVIAKLSFFKTGNVPVLWLCMVFLLKIAAGIFLGFLYRTYFNGGDTFLFFDNGNKMFDVLKENPSDFLKLVTGFGNDPSLDKYYSRLSDWNNYDFFYNDSRTIIRLNALFRIFSFGIYNVHVVFFSFLSLIGLNGLFKIFYDVAPEKKKEIFAAVFLIPSVIFWTSGILKESVLMFVIGIFLYSIYQIINKNFTINILLMIIVSIVFLLMIKVYVFVLLIPAVVAWIWAVKSEFKNVLLKFLCCYFVCSLLVWLLQFAHPELNIISIIYWKNHNFKVMSEYYGSGSYYNLPQLEQSVGGIVKNIPAALLNVFIQPTWNHLSNPFAYVAALENILIIVIMIFSLLYRNNLTSEQRVLFYFSFFFVLSLFILIGLTTPIIGSMVRYKTPALPFLLFMCVLLFDKTKLFSKKPNP